MDKSQLIAEVKERIGSAETEKALNQLKDFLRTSQEYGKLYNLTLQAQARFRKAQRDEIQGLAPGEQTKLAYNQVTRQVLQIVEWLEEGNLQPEADFAEEKSRASRWPWIVAVAALVLILVGGWFFWSRSQPQEAAQATDCRIDEPFRESSQFNILLRPFQALAGEEAPKPHIIIASSLQDFIRSLNIECDFGTLTDLDPNSFFSDTDAETTAAECGAHLIIWGLVEKPSDSDSFNIQTRYRFVRQDSFVKVSKLELSEGSELTKVSTSSIIPTGATLTQSIFESIKLLFGLIAHETGDSDMAIKMLEAYEPPPGDTAAQLARGMVLGDEYLAKGQEEQAWEAYDQLLQTHDYPLARNNRGVLNYKKGDYEEAAEDLSAFLEAKPDNAAALEIRGEAYLQSEQLQKAKLDLQSVRELKQAPNPELDQKIEAVDKRIEEEERTKASAEAEISANPNNLAAWDRKAVSSLRLGDYSEAVRAGEAILRRDPDNADAFIRIIRAYRSAGDTAKVKESIQRAEEAGISRRQLGEALPFYRIRRPAMRFDFERNN